MASVTIDLDATIIASGKRECLSLIGDLMFLVGGFRPARGAPEPAGSMIALSAWSGGIAEQIRQDFHDGRAASGTRQVRVSVRRPPPSRRRACRVRLVPDRRSGWR